MKIKQNGYILLLTLMIISILVFLATYISNRSLTYIPFTKTIINQEQVKILAWGAIQLVISQLQNVGIKKEEKSSEIPIKPDEKSSSNVGNAPSWQHEMLKKLLATMYEYQSFVLKENIEGIDAQIEICLACENSKINLNHLYDFKKKEFKNDSKKLLQNIVERIEKKIGVQNLFAALEKFLKEREYPLEDVTELLAIKEFEWFATRLFYEPASSKPIAEKKTTSALFLTDIFTVWSKNISIEPWFLTPSIKTLLDFKAEKNPEAQKDIIAKQVELFKITSSWKTDWDKLLTPLYQATWQSIPEIIQSIFSTQFGPSLFSAKIKAHIGNTSQILLAILECAPPTSQDDRYQFHVKLKKVYWL
jgi:hypothetical protein